tara:strand:+ start:326 stop:622 length:297 start_codon:yes stop_codon:yes gene_type:complete
MQYEKITINEKVFYLVPENEQFKIKKYAILNDNELKIKINDYINELRDLKISRITFTKLQNDFNAKYNLQINQVNLCTLLNDLNIKKIRPKNIRTLLL